MKTKSQLRKEIAQAKFAYDYAEIHFGFESAERKEAIQKFWDLQKELGAIELRAIGIEPVLCAS
jgi:hypothetical protein